MALPEMTDGQRAAALRRAAEVRRARAEVKEQVARGERTVADVLDGKDDPVIGKMRVSELVRSVPGYGARGSEKLLDELGIDPRRRVAGLGSRQREALLAVLGR